MNTGETIALIKAFGNGGSGSLPSVTSADNGKVLAVKDGAWAADENVLIVDVKNGTTSEIFPLIKAAFLSGKTVIGTYGSEKPLICVNCTDTAANFVSVSNNSTSVRTAQITSSNMFTNVKSLLADVTSADNGAEMIVKNGIWKKQQKKFVVTLTPTSPDYSGTMDKTVAQINAAYEAGQEIVFRIYESPTKYYDLKVTLTEKTASDDYSVFGAYGILTEKLILFYADVIGNTYSTKIYSLTPAS